MATAESVKAKIQGLINTANSTTGGTDTDLTAAVNALIAGFGQGGGGDFEVTEGTITPAAASQHLRIPWDKETLPLFYVCVRPDLDTYVTPDNPATGAVLGGFMCLPIGYIRASASSTIQYLGCRFIATTSYTGYTFGSAGVGDEVLNADGLFASSASTSYKWSTDTTYKYYIVDKVVA